MELDMTDLTCTPPRAGILARLGGALLAAHAHYRREAELRAAIKALGRFDDRLLRDIGLPRDDIEARVREGARR
jgi:uncharacterized protein YjiS (DUF1127 family)